LGAIGTVIWGGENGGVVWPGEGGEGEAGEQCSVIVSNDLFERVGDPLRFGREAGTRASACWMLEEAKKRQTTRRRRLRPDDAGMH